MKTLGEFLNRTSNKDSSIAAELYNPGFDQNSDERAPTESLEPGKHDISQTARGDLSAFAESLQNSENSFSSVSGNSYTESIQDFSAQTRFNLTSTNKDTLGNLLKAKPLGSSEYSTLEQYEAQFGRSTGNNYLNRVVPNTVLNQRSTAYPAPLSNAEIGNVNNAVQTTLEEDNLHAPGRAYLSEPGSEMEDSTIRDGLYSLQNGSFGKFDPQRKRMVVDDLRKATEAMLENARSAATFDGKDDQGFMLSPAAAILQGVYDLRIGNIESIISKFGNTAGAGQDDIARVRDEIGLSTILEGGGATYGVLNTPTHPFNSVSYGMLTTAFLGMVAMRSLFIVYEPTLRLLAELENSKSLTSKILLPASYFVISNELGLRTNIEVYNNPELEDAGRKSKSSDDTFSLNKVFSSGTTLSECMREGFDAFYGYVGSDSDKKIPFIEYLTEAIDPRSYVNVTDSPSYYATIARMVLKDAAIISSSAREFGLDSVGQNINAASKIIEKLASSFTFRLAVNFVKSGYALLTQQVNLKYPTLKSAEKQTTVDVSLSPAGSVALRRDRTKHPFYRFNTGEKGSSLSMRFYDSLVLRNPDVASNHATPLQRQGDSDVTRFTDTEVTDIENYIDGEYMPFSIHDVRTNEIISLPAFIDSISDSFNVSYESTHGYGRTDPVHSYSKTERNISFGFFLVSMGKEDHGYMYNIINKLTSMCYPQRSAGTRRKAEQTEFTQPFSQVPTASPLVRIRIGDLIRSNYVASSFFRVFGDDAAIRNLENSEKIKREFMSKNLQLWREGAAPTGQVVIIKAGTSVRKIKTNGDEYRETLTRDTRAKVIEQYTSDLFTTPQLNLKFDYILQEQKITEFLELAEQAVFETTGKAPDAIVLPSDTEVEFIYDEMSMVTSDSSFYAPSSNAVVRSFKSASGKGMAGFIKDLQLDYMNFNWGVEKGMRAPMGVKVSVTFAPIHDMPLGIDHRGRTISPTHPVNVKYGV